MLGLAPARAAAETDSSAKTSGFIETKSISADEKTLTLKMLAQVAFTEDADGQPDVIFALEDGRLTMRMKVLVDFLASENLLVVSEDRSGRMVLRFQEFIEFFPEQDTTPTLEPDTSFSLKDNRLVLRATVTVPFTEEPGMLKISLPADGPLPESTVATVELKFHHTVAFEGEPAAPEITLSPETGTGPATAGPLTLNFSHTVDFTPTQKAAEAQPTEATGLLVSDKPLARGGVVRLGAGELDRGKLKVALTLAPERELPKEITVTVGSETSRLNKEPWTALVAAEAPPTEVTWQRFVVAGKNHDSLEGELFLNPDLLMGERQIAIQGTFDTDRQERELPLSITARRADGSDATLWDGTVVLQGPAVAKVQVSTDGGGRWTDSPDQSAATLALSPQDRREYEIQARVTDELGNDHLFPDRPVKVRYSAKRFEEQVRARFAEVVAAYNNQDRPGLVMLIGEDFRSNLTSLRTKQEMEDALSSRFLCCPGRVTTSIQSVVTESTGKRATVYFSWTSRSDLGEATAPGQWQFTRDETLGDYLLSNLEEAVSFFSYDATVTKLTLQADAQTLPADNQTIVRLSGTATGPAGLPVANDTRLEIRAEGGTAPASVQTQNGRFDFDFKAGTVPGLAKVTVQSGSTSTSVSLELLPHAPPSLPPEF